MREGIGTTMTGIVHHQRPLLHILLNQACHVGIAVACRRTDPGIGIPHDAFHLIGRIESFHHLCHTVGIGHVGILVAVIAHETQQVLPRPGMFVIDITHNLVHHGSGFFVGTCRDASYGHVSLVNQHVATLAVIHQTEVVIGHIAVGSTV